MQKLMKYDAPAVEITTINAFSCLMESQPDSSNPDTQTGDYGAPKRRVF